jgi:RimJ/RimL family protein N-acetyltransferase
MPLRTEYSPLTTQDIEALVPVLHNEEVFKYIGGMPSQADFTLGLQRAIAGPLDKDSNETWINYAVRLVQTGELIGRVEATLHHNIAEVAFLYSPAVWGRGYALEGLLWLHDHLRQYENVTAFWATTLPTNARSESLLRKAGYAEIVTTQLPWLYTYDEGDLVFRRPAR